MKNIDRPPTWGGWLGSQMQDIRQQAEQGRLAHQARMTERERKEAERAANLELNYVDAIRKWFAALPPDLQRRKFQLVEFKAVYPGRHYGRASAAQIGEALRELGWTQHRSYDRDSRNARFWLAPGFVLEPRKARWSTDKFARNEPRRVVHVSELVATPAE